MSPPSHWMTPSNLCDSTTKLTTMLRPGLVSVTFRKLDVHAVIALARSAGVELIEWGGDVHVPPGDRTIAESVAGQTLAAGLEIAAYGSYFRLGRAADFGPVLKTAEWLGVPTVRIWAGSLGSQATPPDRFRQIARELNDVARQAAHIGKTVSLEFHPGTLTDSAAAALALIAAGDHPAIRTYWQVALDQGEGEQLGSLVPLLPWLSHLHVFNFAAAGTVRLPLAQAEAQWSRLLNQVTGIPGEHGALLEFVRDDRPAAFEEDAACLKRILSRQARGLAPDTPTS